MEYPEQIEGSTLHNNSVIFYRSTDTQPSAPPLNMESPIDYPEEGANNNILNNVVNEPELGAYHSTIDPPIHESDDEYNWPTTSNAEFFNQYGCIAYMMICVWCILTGDNSETCKYMLSERCCCKYCL